MQHAQKRTSKIIEEEVIISLTDFISANESYNNRPTVNGKGYKAVRILKNVNGDELKKRERERTT